MIILLKAFSRRIRNTVREIGIFKQSLFFSFGVLILGSLTYLFIRLFGYIYHQEDFPHLLKLFLSERILLMTFMTIFLMLIISSLTSTLNIFFLSRDLKLLFTTPVPSMTLFNWKTLESLLNSSLLVILFSLPVLIAYCYYFAGGTLQILLIALCFSLFILGGALLGIMIGMIIPLAVSIHKLRPILSIVTILLISTLVIFIRLLKPEQFGDPDIIGNIVQFISGFDLKAFDFFPFAWAARALTAVSKLDLGDFSHHLLHSLLFSSALWIILLVFQARNFKSIHEKLNRGTAAIHSRPWHPATVSGSAKPLWKKETRTFLRTPEQWSQVLIIMAIIVVFIVNMKTIPVPHPSVKNLIAYINLGILTFIIAGLNSRFTFTSIPMENPAILHLIVPPLERRKIYHFKIVFFLVPMLLLGLLLFWVSNLLLSVHPIIRLTGWVYLVCAIVFKTILALNMSFNIRSGRHISSQHLIVTKPGILYMFYSILYIVLSLLFFIRPLYLYFISVYRHRPVPHLSIALWFGAFVLINLLLIIVTYRRGKNKWLSREFT